LKTLEAELRRTLKGDVRFDAQAKALYATDASNYRQVPIGVVLPKDKEDVTRTLTLCREFGAPVLSRGAGTSLAGQCCNVAVVLDMSKYRNRILHIDTADRTARVEPGVILDHLRQEAEKFGLTFGPDPATHSRCTLGGMIGNNSCGVHALMAGKTVDNVESLEILTYDGLTFDVGRTAPDELESIIRSGGRRGEIYSKLKTIRDKYADLIRARFPKIPRRVSGYNLDELLPENGFNVARALVGTEGTCVTVLEASLRLIPSPAARSLLVLGFDSIYAAAEAVPEILTHKPIGLEGFDIDMVDGLRRYQGFPEKIKRLPPGQGWLLIEFGGATQAESDAKANAVKKGPALGPLPGASQEAKDIWAIRESVLAATAFVPGKPDRHEGWEDSAVPPEKLPVYLRDLRALYQKYGYLGAFYGHFGDGCLHTRIDFDLESESGRQAMRRFLDKAADLVVRYGGSLSGEHGDGQARAELFPKMFGPELVGAFREFKTAWDPQNKMNPGKIVSPAGARGYGILDNLRLGENFKPAEPKTHFHFPNQENSFVRAVLRCVGVGKCRNEEAGLMCPSYMVTRDEKDSTRGRAHLLFEMLKGETVKDGWKSEEVKGALDLCLACKGCKSDCPTNVDMATYKAEFLSHYYQGRLRPRSAYAFGLVYWWARAASLMPRLANFLTQTPGFSHLAKWKAGMPQERKIPKFATQTFRSWFKRQHRDGPDVGTVPPSRQVLLWPDTFTNHFHPEIGQAATDVLEKLGYQVRLPPRSLCCGRPLYDYGMLDLAKGMLRQILETLKPDIENGTPVVVLEPSCAAVFRDEMLNLFPDDPLAKRLSQQTMLLSEFLMKCPHPPFGHPLPEGEGRMRALVQPHCHHKSVLGFEDELKLLKQLGLEVTVPDAGCCGMAGSFGFEKEHYDVSIKAGERILLPAVRKTPEDQLIIADGFSCREQIEQATGRRVLHLAELLKQVLKIV